MIDIFPNVISSKDTPFSSNCFIWLTSLNRTNTLKFPNLFLFHASTALSTEKILTLISGGAANFNTFFCILSFETLQAFTLRIKKSGNKIAESLYANDFKKLQQAVTEYLDKSISYYDSGAEGGYHGLVLGLIALMDHQYKIKSNRESGDGRYDICLIPRDGRHPGILMELKSETRLNEEDRKSVV